MRRLRTLNRYIFVVSSGSDVHSGVRGKSLSIQPSIIGHIAKAVALVGQGQQELALEAFHAVFCNCGADEIKFLLLVQVRGWFDRLPLLLIHPTQAILLFLSGKRENAMARVDDLIAVADNSTKYNCLQVCTISNADAPMAVLRFIQGPWKYVPDARRLGTHSPIFRTRTVAFLLPPRLSSGGDSAGKLMSFTNVFQVGAFSTSLKDIRPLL